ncbi:MAG: HesA/MoeB/ThiF family protein [Tenuifilaceae bacterium]|nr:HesA/MoeB/ThiF family protein [Tenuifilaceae bacterium]
MFTKSYERYIRQIRVKDFGHEAQNKVNNAKVLVVGAGALGSPVLSYLAAAGVGTIGVLDSDEVDLTNLQRQVIYTTNDIGQPKAVVASHRLSEMNPEIKIVTHLVRLHKDNALEIIRKYDLVIDCTDNFPSKFLVNDACVMLKKPCIIGGVLRFSGQLSVYNYKGGPTFRCLLAEEPDPLEAPSCSEAGVIGMIPGIVGSMQALEALKVITGIGKTLSGRLLNLDGLTMTFDEFEITLNPENLKINELKEYEYSCPDSILKGREIDGQQFLEMISSASPPFVMAFADDDTPLSAMGQQWDTIPLYELPNKVPKLPQDKKIILVCEFGLKSQAALRFLVTKHKLDNVYTLKDGMASLKLM